MTEGVLSGGLAGGDVPATAPSAGAGGCALPLPGASSVAVMLQRAACGPCWLTRVTYSVPAAL